MKILVTFTGDISGSSQSWGTHIRQAIYLQIVDLTDKKKKKEMCKDCFNDGDLCPTEDDWK